MTHSGVRNSIFNLRCLPTRNWVCLWPHVLFLPVQPAASLSLSLSTPTNTLHDLACRVPQWDSDGVLPVQATTAAAYSGYRTFYTVVNRW